MTGIIGSDLFAKSQISNYALGIDINMLAQVTAKPIERTVQFVKLKTRIGGSFINSPISWVSPTKAKVE
jgi:hypothetical protein